MDETKEVRPHGVPIKVRRAVAYIVLVFFALLCLIWFYILLINSYLVRNFYQLHDYL